MSWLKAFATAIGMMLGCLVGVFALDFIYYASGSSPYVLYGTLIVGIVALATGYRYEKKP